MSETGFVLPVAARGTYSAEGGRIRTWLGARWTPHAVAAGLVPVAASSLLISLGSEHLAHPAGTAAYKTYLIVAPVAVGLLWWHRRGAASFGPLLVLLGFAAWPLSWQGSDRPLLFFLGAASQVPFILLTFFLILSFPSGRLQTDLERGLIGVVAAVYSLSLAVLVLFAPALPSSGPLAGCVGGCPANPFKVGTADRLVEITTDAAVFTGLAVAAGMAVVYALRLRSASRPQRRELAWVAGGSLLVLSAFFAYHLSATALDVSPATLERVGWWLASARVLFPLAFLVAVLRADLFAARARRRLLVELALHPSRERWRDLLARALGDPSLRLGFWESWSGRYVEGNGAVLTHPPADSGSTWVPIQRDGLPLAAMVADEALREEPGLLDAAVAATQLAIEQGNLEQELRASRARLLAAAYAERRRIGRDLHDSAQQRLIALRVHLTLAAERLERAEERALVKTLGAELDRALDELRTVAQGLYPPVLARHGVGEALRSSGRTAAVPVLVRDSGLARHSETVEQTVYFCCLEALQNAAKHAGADAQVTITLEEADGVRFSVEDDGCGFDLAAVERGWGLVNLADRVSAAGGTFRIDSRPGRGTRVTGHIPG